MITGFNTDVRHADTVYHVQTEDKGLNNPLIESLIYVKGAILDAFRTRYEDFLGSDVFSEAILQKILEFQHHQLVAAIKRGKYFKGMPLESYSDGDFIFDFQSPEEASARRKVTVIPDPPASMVPDSVAQPEPVRRKEPLVEGIPPLIPVQSPAKTLAKPIEVVEPPPSLWEPEKPVLPSIDISALSGDQGIEICIEGSKDFHGGEQVDLQLYVQSRQGRLRIENVQVVIKIIGTTFSPRLYAGKTDKLGCLRMNFSLPTFSGGSAALIIQASTSIGNDEVKYLVKRRR